MKYLLLDIDDTIAPWMYKRVDAVVIDSMGIYLGIPEHIAKWLKQIKEADIKIIWCTDRPPLICSMIEKKIGFKSEGQLEFFDKNTYRWTKLHGIIEFCDKHKNDVVIVADNDVIKGTRGVNNLPDNLKMVWPSDTSRGCLSVADLELIENL
ncbi:HAD family hydrolase [Vagococcus fessus]|uniref:FCP1 homology domain-containing protein n=1 Tax=Vagococcus fessus TaxID=120370 RepID=A0A430A6A7_9ENTE|nr:hypothetical protein [Vagococcus fessus]RSU02430.1 hypothetical protein CBF31_08660 [Vagococcus fessus]